MEKSAAIGNNRYSYRLIRNNGPSVNEAIKELGDSLFLDVDWRIGRSILGSRSVSQLHTVDIPLVNQCRQIPVIHPKWNSPGRQVFWKCQSSEPGRVLPSFFEDDGEVLTPELKKLLGSVQSWEEILKDCWFTRVVTLYVKTTKELVS